MTANIVNILCGFVYVINAIVYAAHTQKLPKGFIQCRKSDPNVDECIRGAFQSGIIQLAKGVPSLNLIKIDPLKVAALEIDQGTGPVSINLKFKDLDIINLKSVRVTKAHYDPVNYNFTYELQVPQSILLNGFYEIYGKVLILPIVGKGKCKINLDVSKIVANFKMKPVYQNGDVYLEIEKFTWKLIPLKMHLKMDNLFNGDKALGDNMNRFINDNWRELVSELLPAIEDVFGIVFKGIGQQFLSQIPLNQIILE